MALYDIQRLARLAGGQALFDSILVFENYPLDDALRGVAHGGLAFSGIRAREQTSYPRTVSITQRPGTPDAGLRIDFSFARDAFDEASVAGIARHVSNLLDALTNDARPDFGALMTLRYNGNPSHECESFAITSLSRL
ncbi:condensation domain-containing protein [Caballeronia sp. ATUFL_M2_KS44]|uniref:condensation domain-containing protein n=1 Tax=Caballeronia sp. ATUFL_M2_KS44 TaxID=2921767 RepID=UPI002027C097|nr:condensation domain-containing protein [Caballeronia sp. ATUFL_M2_KS44]